VHHAIATLLCFALFSAFLADSYIHTAHALHSHGPHEFIAHDAGDHSHESGAETDSLCDQAADDAVDPAHSFADHAHGCLLYVGQACTELTVPAPMRQLYFVRESQAHTRCSETLERPPRFIL